MTPMIALYALAAAAVVSVTTLGLLVLFTVIPNPIRTMQRGADPLRWGIAPNELRLSDGCAAWFVPNEASTRAVLIVHGRSRDKSFTLPLISRLASHVNVLAIDLPGHGDSPGTLCTFGVRERDAIGTALDWLEERGFQRIVPIGFSMGGASILMHLGRVSHPAVDGVVTVGTYDSIERVFERVARSLLLPVSLAQLVLRISGRIAGFEPGRVRPVDAVAGIPVPLRVLHGDRDHLVPVDSAYALAAECSDERTLFIYEGGHEEPNNPVVQREILTFIASLDDRLDRPTVH